MRKTLYPKTARVGNPEFQITEKLDGSNLGFFNLDGDLVIAQRNRVYLLSNIEENKKSLYKGLYQFLKDNGEHLLANMHEGSGVFGEWIGMGRLKYGDSLDNKFHIFAKANIQGSMEDEPIEAYNLYWNRDFLVYPFVDQVIPDYISLPNLVATVKSVAIPELNKLYDEYLLEVDRPVEGFIIMNQSGTITKYVRNKGGKMEEHQIPKK